MMASLEDNVVELSSKPHQPRNFKFPKTEYGNKVSRLTKLQAKSCSLLNLGESKKSFQASWFDRCVSQLEVTNSLSLAMVALQ